MRKIDGAVSGLLSLAMILAACGPRPAEATATPDPCPDLSPLAVHIASWLTGADLSLPNPPPPELRILPEFSEHVPPGCITFTTTRLEGEDPSLPPGFRHAIITYQGQEDTKGIQGSYPISELLAVPNPYSPDLRDELSDLQQPFNVQVPNTPNSVEVRLFANQFHIIIDAEGNIYFGREYQIKPNLADLIALINQRLSDDADIPLNFRTVDVQFKPDPLAKYDSVEQATLAAILPTITSSPTPTPSPSETPIPTPTRDPNTITPAEAANTSYQIIANEIPQPDHVTITLRPTESAPIALTTFPYPRDYYQTLTALINNPNTTYSDLESILGKLKWGELLDFWPFSAPPEQKTTVYKDGEVKLNVLGYYPLPFSTTGRKALVWGYDPDTKVVGYSIITAADLPGLTIFTPDNKNIAISPPANNLYSLLEWQLKLNSRDKDGTVYNKLYILPSDYLKTLEDIPASLYGSYLYAIARIHPSVPVFRVGTNGEMTPIDIKTGALATDVRLYSSSNGLEYLIGTVQPTDIAGDTTTGEITIAFQLNQGFSANFEEKHDTPEPDTRPTLPPTRSPSPTPTPSLTPTTSPTP